MLFHRHTWKNTRNLFTWNLDVISMTLFIKRVCLWQNQIKRSSQGGWYIELNSLDLSVQNHGRVFICHSNCHIIYPVFSTSAWEETFLLTFHSPVSSLLNKSEMAINHHEVRWGEKKKPAGTGRRALWEVKKKINISPAVHSSAQILTVRQIYFIWCD